ncbi:hypothetical protein JX265_000783 [Neoarthrinium moseri]|uniref:Chitin-binding type-4 domain-containing protein n=1 Tax=Neoarthrinium moseri TaxID=1658444 RepID=A0A9P9WWG4_9PEZI|nr:uncharacterized protein JN550_007111 [Neoarthrinium moseri]KAI1847532.1 hypothetical protein JX266_006384 [Neoarthrinium moseri]KAI1867380.1 hypothetical protein JN550_007111 [Neoarthrinium moseri]KAI1880543.1 hypothetical protein JX265_000783 [Neoarthrinium moseri]
MFNFSPNTAILAILAACAHGHGVLNKPSPRITGPVQKALCGSAVTTALEKDIAGPIEDALAKADANYKCNAYLCRGYQYEDNLDNVKVVSVGDNLVFHVDLIAGHHPGWANMSAVDLGTNTLIGDALKTWDEWPISGSNEDIDFNVTIPDSLRTPCNEPGKCVLQWYWWSNSNKQTYESCLDFYVEA